MNNKYIALIYKKIHKSISEKELKILNKKLSKDNKLYEEYKLIEEISQTLKDFPESDLPENFRQTLKAKLIQCENNKKRKSFFIIPGITIAALLVALFAIFVINGIEVKNKFTTRENTNVSAEEASYSNNKTRSITGNCIILYCKAEVLDILSVDDKNTIQISFPIKDYNEIKNKISKHIIAVENEETANGTDFIIRITE